MRPYFQARIFFFYVCSLILFARGDNCQYFLSVEKDRRTDARTFHSVLTPSLIGCASACMASPVCVDFNFVTGSRMCHLNNHSSGNDELSSNSKPYFQSSHTKQWKKFLNGPCSSELPSASSTLPGDKTQCESVCGTPPEVPNADVACKGDFHRTQAVYRCKSDFRFCSAQTGSISVCMPSGHWGDHQSECERFRWHNPKVPISQSLPCKDQTINLIKIKATPTKQKLFHIFLRTNGYTISLLITCDFKHSRIRKELSVNDRVNPKSKSRIVSDHFPFTVNKRFLMEITHMRNGTYQISVDGRLCVLFKERQNPVKPKKLVIAKHIRVHSLEIRTSD